MFDVLRNPNNPKIYEKKNLFLMIMNQANLCFHKITTSNHEICMNSAEEFRRLSLPISLLFTHREKCENITEN